MKIPKTVQNSKLFQKSLNTVYQNGLKTQAGNKAAENMAKKVSAKAQANLEAYRVGIVNKNAKSAFDNIKKAPSILDSVIEKSDKKIKGSPERIKQVQNIAKNKALISSAYQISNEEEATRYYNRALIATKFRLAANTTGNMAIDYFTDPFMQQQYGTAAVRAGLGVGAFAGAGVVGSKILSGDNYNNNYYNNLENQNDNGIQNY